MEKIIKPKFSNVQMELLKLYSTNISDSELLELKKVMAKYFLNNIRESATKIWKEKQYSDEFFKKID